MPATGEGSLTGTSQLRRNTTGDLPGQARVPGRPTEERAGRVQVLRRSLRGREIDKVRWTAADSRASQPWTAADRQVGADSKAPQPWTAADRQVGAVSRAPQPWTAAESRVLSAARIEGAPRGWIVIEGRQAGRVRRPHNPCKEAAAVEAAEAAAVVAVVAVEAAAVVAAEDDKEARI